MSNQVHIPWKKYLCKHTQSYFQKKIFFCAASLLNLSSLIASCIPYTEFNTETPTEPFTESHTESPTEIPMEYLTDFHAETLTEIPTNFLMEFHTEPQILCPTFSKFIYRPLSSLMGSCSPIFKESHTEFLTGSNTEFHTEYQLEGHTEFHTVSLIFTPTDSKFIPVPFLLLWVLVVQYPRSPTRRPPRSYTQDTSRSPSKSPTRISAWGHSRSSPRSTKSYL